MLRNFLDPIRSQRPDERLTQLDPCSCTVTALGETVGLDALLPTELAAAFGI
jgi:hypothetical protein